MTWMAATSTDQDSTDQDSTDQDSTDQDRIEAALAVAAGARNAAEAAIAHLVADSLETGTWEGWGIRSPEHWITWKLGASATRARQYTSIARRRQELPRTWHHFTQGALSVDQVALITRHCPADFDRAVAEFALVATIPQLRNTLRRYQWVPETAPPSPIDSGSRRQARSLSLVLGDDGFFDLHVTGPVTDGARLSRLLDATWTRLAAQHAETPHPTVEAELTRYDALVALVDAAANADPSASRRDRARVLFHLDLDQAGRYHAALHLGPILGPEDLRLLACDGGGQILFERSGRPLALGRSSRTVPDWLRTIATNRDGGCRFPGCTQTVNLDVHHMVHWIDGGATDPDNLLTLCARHHTLHHQGHFTITGDPQAVAAPGRSDGLTFRNPHGLELRHPPPPGGPTLPAPTYRHPLGERLPYGDVCFSRSQVDELEGDCRVKS